MANQEQLEILKHGVGIWNEWREENPDLKIDLNKADLRNWDLRHANLSKANLIDADLTEADLIEANLNEAILIDANLWKSKLIGAEFWRADVSEANLSEADLSNADLTGANFVNANLSKANLQGAFFGSANLFQANLVETNLEGTDFSEADLSEANLSEVNLYNANLWRAKLNGTDLSGATIINTHLNEAVLVGTKVDKAKISGSFLYAINIWDLEGEFEEQKDLIITPYNSPVITVDNIKVAQFVYLILNNHEIRDVLNTLTTKTVLILGRFTKERKLVLDALRDKLREENFLPILFDFERSEDRDFTETIKILAGLCYFVIADVTDPSSIPLELQATVPEFQIPFITIIEKGHDKENRPFAMMQNLQTKYPSWMLPTKTYDSLDHLMERFKEGIIEPAKKVHAELRIIKAQKQSLDSL